MPFFFAWVQFVAMSLRKGLCSSSLIWDLKDKKGANYLIPFNKNECLPLPLHYLSLEKYPSYYPQRAESHPIIRLQSVVLYNESLSYMLQSCFYLSYQGINSLKTCKSGLWLGQDFTIHRNLFQHSSRISESTIHVYLYISINVSRAELLQFFYRICIDPFQSSPEIFLFVSLNSVN